MKENLHNFAKSDETRAELEKASDALVVPEAVRNNARRGLELRRKHGRGGITNEQASKQGIGSGVQRASNLMAGRVSYETVKRMKNFFSRHSAFKRFHGDKTSAAYISWLLWGGDAGKRWAESVVSRMENRGSDKTKKSGWDWIAESLGGISESLGELLRGGESSSINDIMSAGDEICDCAECMSIYSDDRFGDYVEEDYSSAGGDDDILGEQDLNKARKVPEKYLEGLTGEERQKRKKEIQERMESGKTGGYKELTGDDEKTKPSKYSQTNIAARIRKELKGKTSKGEFLTVAARVSGVARSILERCYDRGMAAWATGGHRPGASQTAWAVARVYSLLSGGKTRTTADKDLWAEHLKNKREK